MGLPHSEMMGSRPDCGSSIVSLLVCVLRRLVVPRHPPTAHHVLPGHGVLGGRGVPCWAAHDAEWHPGSSSDRLDHSKMITNSINRKQMKLVRCSVQGTRNPCPLTCATGADLEHPPRDEVTVLVENIPIQPWLSNRIAPNGDCWKQSSLERR